MKKIFITLIIITVPLLAQKDLERELSGYTNPEELVTLSSSIPFKQAVEVLSKVSKKSKGQNIVSTSEFNEPIGIQIDNMHYRRALDIIVQYNNLIYEEEPEVIVVKDKEVAGAERSSDVYASVDSREVKISAVFFEANITEMRERGINWQFLFSRSGLTIGPKLNTFLEGQEEDEEGGTEGGAGEQQQNLDFNVSTESEFTMGEFDGTAESIFKFFEEENLGEVIARPSISVRDGLTGRIQIGEDISIKQRDFAGNVIDVFFPTGTIIDVTPYIYKEDGVDYVLLQLNAERSSPIVISETSTRISKTNAQTEVLMLDGEKTVIGGLIVNEESNVRRGIPILKDLPWWVFGLKYLFGYSQKQLNKKEVIILLEAEILPSLKERITDKNADINMIKEQREKNRMIIEKYRTENMKDKQENNGEEK